MVEGIFYKKVNEAETLEDGWQVLEVELDGDETTESLLGEVLSERLADILLEGLSSVEGPYKADTLYGE